ncbi:ImmA/IrrE family metallo-endopeptidase [Liquorilactobacillus hordei]|uniref:IrrE N-terminal-like domain-containing protein n=1 Tax=Liquorilactobacillus hordei DSM 19519 TaxID=1423759 RepID=A0A0R1MIB0_9LACO|nr:ImmA/IrrE family metallo-endopeptidase [Liquorilactobacillus hordei]KRL07710.1 hypothetical protein FC92_GL001658 [Liquorilactobacillus hordei DSM 19519]QYH52674.1 ImmA/IrrE family metallo-endopeptidase [Liquorilactobacillus hordei DSM 19519]
MERLLKLAEKEHIEIIWSQELSPTTPPIAAYNLRCIIMNSNWYNPNQFIFQLAHELSHLIYGDPLDLYLYNQTPAQKFKIEAQTNDYAIQIILHLYNESPYNRINIVSFMQEYAIPTHLESRVRFLINTL